MDYSGLSSSERYGGPDRKSKSRLVLICHVRVVIPRNSVMQVDIKIKVRLTTKIMKNKVRIIRSCHDPQQIKTDTQRDIN